jgi:hypothetical protein
VGRAVVALALDYPKTLERSGQLFSSWEVGRKYRLTDVDGRRPDWGKLDVDFSQLPKSLIEEMTDALRVQESWLKVLSRRTERYRASFTRKTAQLRPTIKRRQSAGGAGANQSNS